MMLAGATAQAMTGSEAGEAWVSAFVVLSAGPKSRVFKVTGRKRAPQIDELAAATTLDMKRFQDELKQDLFGMGPPGAPDKEWVLNVVRDHIKRTENVEVG